MKKTVKPKKLKGKKRGTTNKGTNKVNKDKSVKQNVNVNVSSSGGSGGSGAMPMPFHHPLMVASSQGQKTGENVQLKNLIDLLVRGQSGTLNPSRDPVEKQNKAPTVAPTVAPIVAPLFEDDEAPIHPNITVRTQRNNNNISLAEQVMAMTDEEEKEALDKMADEEANRILQVEKESRKAAKAETAEAAFVPEEVEEAEAAQNMAVSSDAYDAITMMDSVNPNIYIKKSYKIDNNIVNTNTEAIDKIISTTSTIYQARYAHIALLPHNGRFYKYIEGDLIPWSSHKAGPPLPKYTKYLIQEYYSKNSNEIKEDAKNNTPFNLSLFE